MRSKYQRLTLKRSDLLRLRFNNQAAFSLVCTYREQRTFFHFCVIKQAIIEYLIETLQSLVATGERRNTRFKMLGSPPPGVF